MEVRLYPNSRRPGVGMKPRRESQRPLLPQHARHCPVLEAGSAAEDGCREGSDQCLTTQIGKQGKENGGHRGNTGAEPIHMIQNAERSGDSHHPQKRQPGIQPVPCLAPHQHAEYLRVNPGNQEKDRRQRHAHK
jgi:hypothetical protein